jgi:hypothetical protein
LEFKISRHEISTPLTDVAMEWIFVKRRFIPLGGVRQLADGVVKSDKNKINLQKQKHYCILAFLLQKHYCILT